MLAQALLTGPILTEQALKTIQSFQSKTKKYKSIHSTKQSTKRNVKPFPCYMTHMTKVPGGLSWA